MGDGKVATRRRPKREPFRGAGGNMRLFAPIFVRARLEGFAKDMEICLTGVQSKTQPGELTHAYFPALMSCCGTLEYLTGLYCGRTKPCSDKEIMSYASHFLPNSVYTGDVVRVLHLAFRHPVAHRGIASGVWVDKNLENGTHRMTWKIGAEDKSPAIQITPQKGFLRNDSPWECRYTHRVHIRLGRLWRDIRESALATGGYCDKLTETPELLKNFEVCMRHMYPPE